MKYLYAYGTPLYLQELKRKIFLFSLAVATIFTLFPVTNHTDELPAVACHALIKAPSGLIHYTDLQLNDLHSIQPVIMNCTLSGSGAAPFDIYNEWLQPLIQPADCWCVAVEPGNHNPDSIKIS